MKRDIHGVDSGLVKGTHAGIVIEGVVHAVNTDDVDTELLQIGDIASTSSAVS